MYLLQLLINLIRISLKWIIVVVLYLLIAKLNLFFQTAQHQLEVDGQEAKDIWLLGVWNYFGIELVADLHEIESNQDGVLFFLDYITLQFELLKLLV